MEDVWENACTGKYGNGTNGKDGGPSFGMFGTGFLSFKRYSNDDNWNQQMREFIKMLIMMLKRLKRQTQAVKSQNLIIMKIATSRIIQILVMKFWLRCLEREMRYEKPNKAKGSDKPFGRNNSWFKGNQRRVV